MNPIVEEMKAILEGDEDALAHYGVKRRSGRYPWGSGEDPYQHGQDFLGRVEQMRKRNPTYTDPKTGVTYTGDTAIAKKLGLTTSQFRTELSLAKSDRRLLRVARAKSLKEDGLNPTEIGREMGINESTVRSLLNPTSETNMLKAKNTADIIRKNIDEKGMIDVGAGVELSLGVSKEMLNKSLYLLQREGYPVWGAGVEQATNAGQQTILRVACPPGTPHKAIYEYDKIHTIDDYTSHDGGVTFDKFQYPKSMDSKRLMIRYADDVGPDGARGVDKDGVIEIRRGVEDLSLGDSRYSQVRILVDNDRYLKGMAVYSDDMPDGVDVVFNTNKTSDKSMRDVLKEIKKDPDNPFGSLIKADGQSYYTDKDGNRQLSLINKRADEGDWSDWTDALPSQFLGKQSKELAKRQLGIAKADKQAEFDAICELTNPTVKKHFLREFADNCDAAAVHLKAAALPGQKYHVIIPINTLKDNEVYAPGYKDGTELALIRYPHGGTFEIPILKVNNSNELANKIITRDSMDAIGITKYNADRLSGADFDGDTVMCIPTNDPKTGIKIASTRPLKGLEGFEPKDEYAEREGMRYMKDPKTGTDNTQKQMGMISNLITDMTLAGANEDELARAVRHSMVVIDAGKHKLDYKRSEQDHNIAELQKLYQRHVDENGRVHYGGASTILSRASGQYSVPKRQGSPYTNIEGKPGYDPTKSEGAKLYKTADDLWYPKREYNKATGIMTLRTADGKKITYDVNDKEANDYYNPIKRVNKRTGEVDFTNKDGTITYKKDYKKQQSKRMAETDDAYDLVSEARHPMEIIYADHANSMKALANKARLELANTGKIQYDANAKKIYKAEYDSLMSKLNTALMNAPRERQAQLKTKAEVNAKTAADETLNNADKKKLGQLAITKYRNEFGVVSRKDRSIQITDREWEAIQAGAVSETTLTKILANSDPDILRERATPRTSTTLTPAKINRIKRLQASNLSIAEIAEAIGVSTSTVYKQLKGVS